MVVLYPNPEFVGTIEHLQEVSCYNNNYYRFNGVLMNFNIDTNIENIILEECNEDDNYYSLELGHFDENNKFHGVAWWDSDFGSDGINEFIREQI